MGPCLVISLHRCAFSSHYTGTPARFRRYLSARAVVVSNQRPPLISVTLSKSLRSERTLVVDQVVDLVVDSVGDLVVDRVLDLVVFLVVDRVVDRVVEPVVDPVVGRVVDIVVELVVDLVGDPVVCLWLTMGSLSGQ